jgi:RimJ/RimL family protein N-acetyltransferase
MGVEKSNYFWQGTKIRLRETQLSDWLIWKSEGVDSDGLRLLDAGIELPRTEATVQQMADKFDSFKDIYRNMFTIETLSGEVVGGININSLDQKNGTFSFGTVTYRQFRQKGYGEEALRIILRYGFLELRLQKCNSSCMHTNEGSIKLHRKVGFKDEGRRRRTTYTNGQYFDDLLFGLTNEEFEDNDKLYKNLLG